MGQTSYQTSSCVVVHFGDIPAENIARVVDRTHQQSKKMSVRGVADCLTKIISRRRLDFIRTCIRFNVQSPNKDELTKELLQYQEAGTEVTAELCSKQGNTHITEVVVIDEMAQCEVCEEHNAKGKSFCKCGSMLQELSADKTETSKVTTKQDMIRVLQWRQGRTRGHA